MNFWERLKFCWRFLFINEIDVDVQPLVADYSIMDCEYIVRMRIDIIGENFYVDHCYSTDFIDDLFGKRTG